MRAVYDVLLATDDMGFAVAEAKRAQADNAVSPEEMEEIAEHAIADHLKRNAHSTYEGAFREIQEGLGVSQDALKNGLKEGIAFRLAHGENGDIHDEIIGCVYSLEDDPRGQNADVAMMDKLIDTLEKDYGMTLDDVKDIARKALETVEDPEYAARLREQFALDM